MNCEFNNAIRKAIKIRLNNGFTLIQPFPIYDFLYKNDIEIRFVDIASMEGMYVSIPRPVILINSDRPKGRQLFTCAHEYAHHIFNHGNKIDEFILSSDHIQNKNIEEVTANIFASGLLMPRKAILYGFNVREWRIKDIKPEQFYTIANWLGVSYAGMINQLYYSYKLLNKNEFNYLIKISPQEIKNSILGYYSSNLMIIDDKWIGDAIDLELEDNLFINKNISITTDKLSIVDCRDQNVLYEAVKTGVVFIMINQKTIPLRISKKEYKGLSQYRFLEEI